jgi:hypothetical protein
MEPVTEPPDAPVLQMLDIRWEEGFEASLVQAIPDPEQRATVCERIEWVLALRAESVSKPVVGTDYRVYVTEAAGTASQIGFFFRIEDELVALIRAERVGVAVAS